MSALPIRAANHSSYPPIEDHGLDDDVRRHRELDADSEEAVAKEAESVSIAVAEQARAFIDVVTDGGAAGPGRFDAVAGRLGGVAIARAGGDGPDPLPRVVGAIARTSPLAVRSWVVAADVAMHRPVKVSLPGAALFAACCEVADDAPYEDRDAIARAYAGVLAQEIAGLAEAGCRVFQLDEALCEDDAEGIERIVETANVAFAAAPEGSTTIVALGGIGAARAGAALARIPGTHVGIDVTGSGALDALVHLPADRGVQLGLFDASSEEVEDAADIVRRLEAHRATLEGREVWIGPAGGLGRLSRDAAFDKLQQARYVVEDLAAAWAS